MPTSPLPRDVILRRALSSDASALAAVYRSSVTVYGADGYDAEQVRIWAQSADRLEACICPKGFTLLAEVAGEAACFGRLFPDDHIDLLYCAPPHGRRGLASAVLAALEAEAQRRGAASLTVEASLVARGIFEKHGYQVVAEERVDLRGALFRRFRMAKGVAP